MPFMEEHLLLSDDE